MGSVTLARQVGVGKRPWALRGKQGNAVHRAGRQAQFAARAMVGKHGVHQLGGADDRVHRAGRDAQRAADARLLVDARGHKGSGFAARTIERKRWQRKQTRKRSCGRLAARRTAIGRRRPLANRFGIGKTTVVAAAPALRLRQQRVDAQNEQCGAVWVHAGILPLPPGVGDARRTPASRALGGPSGTRIRRLVAGPLAGGTGGGENDRADRQAAW